MTRYLVYRWYGRLTYNAINRETDKFYFMSSGIARRIDKNDRSVICVTTDLDRIMSKLEPIEAAFIAESKAADDACRKWMVSARDIRDAAIKGVLDDEQP